MRSITFVASAAALFVSIAVACGGEKKLGETCDESGKTEGECESGGVCGKNTGTVLYCLKICTQQSDCAAAEDCNGVEGTSTKGCRLKDATSSGGADGGKK